jgi:hypothetical protein
MYYLVLLWFSTAYALILSLMLMSVVFNDILADYYDILTQLLEWSNLDPSNLLFGLSAVDALTEVNVVPLTVLGMGIVMFKVVLFIFILFI